MVSLENFAFACSKCTHHVRRFNALGHCAAATSALRTVPEMDMTESPYGLSGESMMANQKRLLSTRPITALFISHSVIIITLLGVTP